MFKPELFLFNLRYMGIGMLGVMLVIGFIIGVTYLLNYFYSKKP